MKPPLSASDLYHTGIVVGDVEEAANRLTALAGYRWTAPMDYTLPVTTVEGVRDIPFHLTYSVQYPHLELLAAVPGTLWTASGSGPHHLGYWVDDIADASARLAEAGFAWEAGPAPGQHPSFAYHIDAAGTRVEIVDRALFPDWPGFLRSMTTE